MCDVHRMHKLLDERRMYIHIYKDGGMSFEGIYNVQGSEQYMMAMEDGCKIRQEQKRQHDDSKVDSTISGWTAGQRWSRKRKMK